MTADTKARDAPPSSVAQDNGKIVARDIAMTFGNVRAIENVTCSIAEREFVSIIGPSGCGKSTFLYLIAGFEKAASGSLVIDGRPVTKPGPDRGVVFQEFVLYPWRTVLRNITLGLEIQKVPKQEARERARKWISLAGLSGFENAYPATLSGGMKQRVAIARALAYEPEILLLDEPFGALDVQTKHYMMRDLQALWLEADKTIVMVTHSVKEATFLSDRVIVFGARPSKIVANIRVDIPHPRSDQDPALHEFEDRITRVLSAEVDRAMALERART